MTIERKPFEGIAEEEAERMFRSWADNPAFGAYTRVAKEFNHSRSTVYRVAERYDWNGRINKIRANLKYEHNRMVVKKGISSLEVLQAFIKKWAAYLLKTDATPTIGEMLAAMRLEQDILKGLPADGDRRNGVDVTVPLSVGINIYADAKPEQQPDVDRSIAAILSRGSTASRFSDN